MDEMVKNIAASLCKEQVTAVAQNRAELSKIFALGPRIMIAFNPKVRR